MGKQSPLISVILPTFNRASTLPAAIGSVLSQSFEDFELLIIDDGSTDGTQKILDPLCADDPRIRRFAQQNSGVSRARNFGIKEARGHWIAFLDSDDTYHPNKLEKLVQYSGKRPDARFIYSGYVRRLATGETIGKSIPKLAGVGLKPHLLLDCPIATPTVMMKKDLIDEIGLFDVQLNLAEDLDLWCRANSAASFHVIPEPLVDIYVRGKNPLVERDVYLTVSAWQTVAKKHSDLSSAFGILTYFSRKAHIYKQSAPSARIQYGRFAWIQFIFLANLYDLPKKVLRIPYNWCRKLLPK